MAVDLPPVIPPQLSEPAKIRAQVERESAGAPISTRVGGYQVQVTGNRWLDASQVQSLFTDAKDASDAIRALNAAYYAKGHLLVTVYYAVDGERLLVHVINGVLEKVEAPDAVKPYFAPLEGDSDLTVAEFDRRRVLADLRSRRAGVNYTVTYRLQGDPTAYTLVLTESDVPDHDPDVFRLQMGNQGNRFLGRYFGGASWQRDFSGGSRLNLSYDKGIPEFGADNGGKRYDGLTAKLDRPFTFGLYGVELSYIEYEREVMVESTTQQGEVVDPIFGTVINPGQTVTTQSVIDLQSDVMDLALKGEQVLRSAPDQRLTIFQSLRLVDADIETESGQTVLDEEYGVVSLGFRWSAKRPWLGSKGKLAARIALDAGLGGDGGTLESSDDQGAVAPGRRSADFQKLSYSLAFQSNPADGSWLFSGELFGQEVSGNQLPQQEQLVLGGMQRISAWLPGVLLGDSGAYARVELGRDPLTLLGIDWTPSLFVEYGRTEFEDASASVANGLDEPRSITDAGLRLRGQWGDRLAMEWVVAESLQEKGIPDVVEATGKADFFWRLQLKL